MTRGRPLVARPSGDCGGVTLTKAPGLTWTCQTRRAASRWSGPSRSATTPEGERKTATGPRQAGRGRGGPGPRGRVRPTRAAGARAGGGGRPHLGGRGGRRGARSRVVEGAAPRVDRARG